MSAGYAYLLGVDVLAGRSVIGYADAEEETDQASPALRPFSVTSVPTALVGHTLKSEIPEVSDAAWTKFALAMKTASPSAISDTGAYGMFQLKPRRLADLGLMKNLVNVKGKWTGDWVEPLTEKVFLASPPAQYRAFGASMRRYVDGLRDRTIPRPEGGRPEGATLSGILAVLHRCGPSGLKTWNDVNDRFPDTVALYQKANGIF